MKKDDDILERQSRWDDAPALNENGQLKKPFFFTENDLEICKLLAPSGRVRDPWSYQYLPTNYIAGLLARDLTTIQERTNEMYRRPLSYLARPDQFRKNDRSVIHALAKNGIDAVRDAGGTIRDTRLREMPHELMSCVIAASFEYGAKKHRLEIDTDVELDLDFYPDRRPFKLKGKAVFIEADTGSMVIERKGDGTDIYGKIEQYLKLKILRRSIVFFVTTKESRCHSMVNLLKRVIDDHDLDHDLAGSFCFTHITYDRFINTIPKLTDWAVAGDHQRAGFKPFNFLKE